MGTRARDARLVARFTSPLRLASRHDTSRRARIGRRPSERRDYVNERFARSMHARARFIIRDVAPGERESYIRATPIVLSAFRPSFFGGNRCVTARLIPFNPNGTSRARPDVDTREIERERVGNQLESNLSAPIVISLRSQLFYIDIELLMQR